MFVTFIVSSALIIRFDLDSINSSDLDEVQQAISYLIMVLLSVNIGCFVLSCGLVENYCVTVFPCDVGGFDNYLFR